MTSASPKPEAEPSTCPYLGQAEDRETFFLQPSQAHRCWATDPPSRIDLDHQLRFCYGHCTACSRYPQPGSEESAVAGASARPEAGPTGSRSDETADAAPPVPAGGMGTAVARRLGRLSFEEWVVYAVTATLLLIAGYYALVASSRGGGPQPTLEPALRDRIAALDATTTSTPTPAPADTPRPTRAAANAPIATVAVPAPPPGGLMAALSPSERGVGPFNDRDRLPSYGQRELLVGRFEDQTYLGGILIPLQRIPKGSRITYAALELTGLSDSNLAQPAAWSVDLLDPEAEAAWGNLTFATLVGAPAKQVSTGWTIPSDALAPRKVNVLPFSDQARDALMGRLAGSGRVAFRIRGPSTGPTNLFAWDTGYGEGFGTRPILRVGFVPPPPTPGAKPGEPTVLPLIVWVSEPTPAASSTPLPPSAPAVLRGKILFLSDRFGPVRLMVMDPATRKVGQVTQSWVYTAEKARMQQSAGLNVRVAGRPCGSGATPVVIGGREREPGDPVRNCAQILVTDPDGTEREVTPPGFVHYDPTLSPDGQWLAYVSQITGGDEVFKIRVNGEDNTRLTENVWEWDKHPSWSPDGSRIVFWSNRTGKQQLFAENADGSGVENLSQNPYNDWDPVWVR